MKTVLYDLKRNYKAIGIFCLFSFVVIAQFWRRDLRSYSVAVLNYYFFWTSFIGMMVVITNLHMEDFRSGAIKELYVFIESGWKLIARRLLSVICVAGIFYLPALINQTIGIQKLKKVDPSLVEGTYALNLLVIYMGAAVFLSAYVMLIAYSVRSYKKAYFIAVLPPLVLNYLLPFIITQGQLDENGPLGMVSKILKKTPNGIITVWSQTQMVSWEDGVLLLVYIAGLYAVAYVFYRNRDCI
ncbi:hypothetical protein [Aristaeella hokkaidonensis]|uniref:Uncharacterized protein n=1 Tax=Aristaeella hokkaidonensis TaxID=3046382 RepID=A0AC61N2B8_9FIRM|nr:hypothetical protein [Aristaeella hokkaidonensis]QTE69797.1 hypothetical protein JRC49_08195 [Clostridiales bacterium FE2011]QUC66615.1 hypothetical protein JYE49_12245 [Aristaeella hokkaidonensis]SNT95206.1 hypothetical protein SAMN06297421_11074 [Aristaeella hokkaidonensis]